MTQHTLFGTQLPPPSCVLSPCGKYRYELRIPLSRTGGTCLFVLANPSKAVVIDGVLTPDPTMTKCIGYARRWGMGTVVLANVRAWRETNPKLVPADPEAIGPENDARLLALAAEADTVVCGWGRLGEERGPAALSIIRLALKVPYALKLTEDGVPWHPLYLPNHASLIAMRPESGIDRATK